MYELGAGWIFWSVHHELAGPWSWTQSAAQNWIPMDPSEKIWPFNPDASSYCLDTFNPLEGDQNLPYFPSYANNYTNIDISSVKPVKLNANPAPDSTGASATSSSTTSRSQSSTASPSGSSSESGSLYTAPLPSSLILLFMMVMVVSVSRL